MSSLGLTVLSAARGLVRFRGTAEDGTRATLALRTAPRLVLELGDVIPATPDDLRDGLRALRFEDHLPADVPWAVRAIGTSPLLRHTGFTARFAKDAIRDRFNARGRTCPPVDPQSAQVLVEIRIDRGEAQAGLDLGGASLHERGTGRQGEAPLREDVAAGLAWLAGASPERPIVDPFCGTGTLIAEAAAVALRIPPPRRAADLAIGRLPAFRGVSAAHLAAELASRTVRDHAPFLAYDIAPRMVAQSRAAFAAQGLADHVKVTRGAVPDLPLPADLPPGLLLTNPPWGVRFDETEAAAAWAGLGRFAHGRLSGWTLAALSGNAEMTRHLGLRAERRFPVVVGGIDTRLLVYSVR